MNAIELTNVSKIYRRYGGKQFATLKSALLQRSILRDLSASETFPALTDVSFTVRKGSTYGVIGRVSMLSGPSDIVAQPRLGNRLEHCRVPADFAGAARDIA